MLHEKVKPAVAAFLRERGLELSPEKTQITKIEDGFDFLGQTLRKFKGKLVITPSKKNVKTFLEKVRTRIKANGQATTGTLIQQLNPLLRGWANYHRHVSSKATFAAVDHAIFKAIWRWARRRHPNKHARWVQQKYFCQEGERSWVLAGEVRSSDGQTRTLRLLQTCKIPIRRHVKVRETANPYDPAWEVYFEARLGVKMSHTLRGRRKLSYLWREQNGVCPLCHQKITTLTGWHNHHIVARVDGGADSTENRVLLHPECHRQLHSQHLFVAKPRPLGGVEEA